MKYNSSAMEAVFGEQFEEIKDFSQAVAQMGKDMGNVAASVSNNLGEIKKSLKDAGLSAEQFEQYLEISGCLRFPTRVLKSYSLSWIKQSGN